MVPLSLVVLELMCENSDFAVLLNCNSHFGSDYENIQIMCCFFNAKALFFYMLK